MTEEKFYFRGARNGGVVYYVDGVKQRDGDYKIPSTAVASIMVYMGDVPAKYGDFDRRSCSCRNQKLFRS